MTGIAEGTEGGRITGGSGRAAHSPFGVFLPGNPQNRDEYGDG